MPRHVLRALVAGLLVTTGATSLAQQAAAPSQLTQPPGPATFFSVHAAGDLNTLAADVAFLGVPYDGGHFGKTGTRLGPQSIREASRLGPGLPAATNDAGLYDWERGERILAGVRLVDVGNVRTPPGASELVRDRVTEIVAMIVARGAMPVVFGGDHSITFPILRGFRQAGHKVHVIHFDSHADFNNTTIPGDGIQYTHGNHLRHSVDLPFVSGITMIGLRGHLRGEGVPTQARQRGIQMLSASQAVRMGPEKVVAQIPAAESYYVTFDIDVIDPSVAPGTGTPLPGGLTYYQACDLLDAIAAKGRIVGFDIMEVSPPYDVNDTTARLAGHLVMRFLGSIFANRSKTAR